MHSYLSSHVFQALILPPGLFLLLGLAGFLLLKRCRRIGKSLLFLSFLTLWILSTPIVAIELIDGLQSPYPPLQLDKLAGQKLSGAIVVLGGGAGFAPEYANQHYVSTSTLQRIHYAAYLNRKLHLPIIVSGGKSPDPEFTEAGLMANILNNELNISVKFKESQSINTSDESRYLQPVFKQLKITTIYLVTNAWHMSRSIYVFKQPGLTVVPAPMGYILFDKQPVILNFLPSLESLNASTVALHEYFGIWWYQLRAHLRF